jgi:hypothetical protein
MLTNKDPRDSLRNPQPVEHSQREEEVRVDGAQQQSGLSAFSSPRYHSVINHPCGGYDELPMKMKPRYLWYLYSHPNIALCLASLEKLSESQPAVVRGKYNQHSTTRSCANCNLHKGWWIATAP